MHLHALGWYLILMDIAAFAAFWIDKRTARRGGRRIRERTLLALCLLGGAAGGLLAMVLLRHKTRKGRFRAGVPVMLALQAAFALYARRGGLI